MEDGLYCDHTLPYTFHVQLRVRAGVQLSAVPPEFSYGPFTNWERVGDGVPISK